MVIFNQESGMDEIPIRSVFIIFTKFKPKLGYFCAKINVKAQSNNCKDTKGLGIYHQALTISEDSHM